MSPQASPSLSGPARNGALWKRGLRALVKTLSGLIVLVGLAYLGGLFLRLLGRVFELGWKG